MSDNNQQNQPPVRKRNALNNSKLSLSAKLPNSNIFAQLSVSLFKNNPRFVFNAKDPSLMNRENNFGKIEAAFDSPVFFGVLELLREAINSREVFEKGFENSNHEFVNGQRSQDIRHLTTLKVGRDQDGHIYISVTSTDPKWPKVKFIFGVPDQRYHRLINADGSPANRAQLSNLMARAYLNMWSEMVSGCLVVNYEDIPPPNGRGGYNKGGNRGGYGGGQGGGRGGYGGGSNGGGGYNRNNSGGKSESEEFSGAPANAGSGFDDLDDNIPF